MNHDIQNVSGNIARDSKGDQKYPKETEKRRNEETRRRKANNSEV